MSPDQSGYTSNQADPRRVYYITQASMQSALGGHTPQQRDPRSAYFANDAPVSVQQGGYTSQQPVDLYHSRGVYSLLYLTQPWPQNNDKILTFSPVTYVDYPQSRTYENPYQDPTPYAQPPVAAPSTTVGPSEYLRKEREKAERDRHVHRRR